MKIIHFVFLLFFTITTPLNAKTLVLIHGYMEDGMAWRNSGASIALQQNNWIDGGALRINQYGVVKYPAGFAPKNRDVFYTVELPWTKPIEVQSQLLLSYLQAIYSVRQENLALAAHSNGGVVARYFLVNNRSIPVNALITVASPHLGSSLAKYAYLMTKTPADDMAKVAGNDAIKKSKRLFAELKPEKPINFLYRLNHQMHPNIHYLSIVRSNHKKIPSKFDYVASSDSQNMNYIYALRGRSAVFANNQAHGLSALDGWLIAQFLRNI